MCGIAGLWLADQKNTPPEEFLRRMADAIAHRGPDGEGFECFPGVGLAHRRLSIIDLAGGRQPLSNETKDVWVVFNGEIFNFLELRPTLEAKGHVFRTHSDTETIVHLYEEVGEDFPKYLRGQFAIGIWDARQRKLVLVRDRMGQKPLYLYQDADRIAFASEMKSIFALPGIRLTLDPTVLPEYFTYGFLPAPRTQFSEITKLEPGMIAVWQNQSWKRDSYWEMPFPTDLDSGISDSEALRQLEQQLDEATRLRLIADVPVGAFLSGGIDSSLIVSTVVRQRKESRDPVPTKTFSIAFAESDYDESPYARLVAQRLETDHQEMLVDFRIEDVFAKILRHFDEPFADSSAIPQYFVSQAARQQVKVVLSGDAGDEFFWGYRRYLARRLHVLFRRMPSGLQKVIEEAAATFGSKGDGPVSKSIPRMLLRFVQSARFYDRHPDLSFLPFFSEKESAALLRIDVARSVAYGKHAYYELMEKFRDRDAVCQMSYLDQRSYLPEDILVKVDRMSMAHGLEVRSPLLDHKLVEWAAALPGRLKLSGFRGKALLRTLALQRVPRSVIERRKQGFAVPIPRWFRGPLRDLIRSELAALDPAIFSAPVVEALLDDHMAGRRDLSQQIWALMSLRQTFRVPPPAS